MFVCLLSIGCRIAHKNTWDLELEIDGWTCYVNIIMLQNLII